MLLKLFHSNDTQTTANIYSILLILLNDTRIWALQMMEYADFHTGLSFSVKDAFCTNRHL